MTEPDPATPGPEDAGRPGAGPRAAGPALAERLRSLGPRAVRRPPVCVGEAVAGVGGALVAGGLIAVTGDGWATTGSVAVAVAVTGTLLVTTALALAVAGGPARAAAVSASGLAAPALAFFVNAGDGIPSVRGTALVAGLLLGVLYLAGPWRGHTFHLAVLVAAGWLFALSLGEAGLGASFLGGLGTLADVVAGAGVASMAAGVLYLAAGTWLHGRGLEGMATPFLAVGAVALPVGTVAAVQDELPAAVAVFLVGAAVAAVGGWCRRRGTTWTGAALAAAGVVGAGAAVSDGVVGTGMAAAAAGALLVALAVPAAAAVGERAGPGEDPS